MPYASRSSGDDGGALNILSTCWYVFAVLVLLPSCIGGIYMAFGLIFGGLGAAAGASGGDAGGGLAFGALGMIPCCFGGALASVFIVLSFLSYRTGRNLAARRNHTLCFVTGLVVCLIFPLGTILGVFTLVTINKPEVKILFT